MGQKVNPIIFRDTAVKLPISAWSSQKNLYPHFVSQDLEIRDFLAYLLKSRGILVKSCRVFRLNQSLLVDLDLYFSFVLSKHSKFSWAKSFFVFMKRKYTYLNRIKDLKNFLDSLIKNEKNFNNKLISDLPVEKKNLKRDSFISVKNSGLDYRHRFFFLLILKERRKHILKKKKKMSLLSIVKRSSIPKLVRLKLPRLSKLFIVNKLKFDFRNFSYKNTFLRNKINCSFDLLELNKILCQSLQHFTGNERIHIRISSSQLFFLPTMKLYLNFLKRELATFQRSKNLSKFFFETVEILYFVVGTFTRGNASLLATFLSYLLETNRKHLFVVKFVKKVLSILFNKMPGHFLAISGIKIMVKGRFNKRRRTKTIVIQEGQVCLQTIDVPIDYCQTFAVTLYGSFGIKVWLSKK